MTTEATMESPEHSYSPHRTVNYDYSLPNIQQQQARASSTIVPRNMNINKNVSTMPRRYQSQRDLDSE